MVTLLQDDEADLQAEELDTAMTEGEQQAAVADLRSPPVPVDSLKGGRGNRIAKGRAVARRAWRYDGTPSVLPIAWNPEGTRQDGGRAYMSKRHCLCCDASGFRGECVRCVRSNCLGCSAGSDKAKIIPLYYLRKEKVPFPRNFYGSIDCFLPSCIRRNGLGFQTEEEMRMHARGRHRMEYLSHQEAEASRKGNETDELRRRLDELTRLFLTRDQTAPPVQTVQTAPSVQMAPPMHIIPRSAVPGQKKKPAHRRKTG